MNSKQLQKEFPAVYQKFFFKCQKVASAPHSFFWIGDFSGFYGGLTISSKLPLRFYVGLEKIGKDKFEIEDEFQAYFPSLSKFQKIRLDAHIKRELTDILENKFKGYRLNFLTELSLGLSLGGLGAISAAISQLILPEGDIDQKFKIAKTIVTQIQIGRTSGATAYCALSESDYPCVFYQSGAKSWGKSLDELSDLPKNPAWAFDFGLIFSGNLVAGAAVIASAEQIKRISTRRQNEISNLIGEQTGSFWGEYLKMLDQVSKQTLLNFIEVFKGANDNRLRNFFEGLNQYQNLLHYLEISTTNIDRIYSLVHKISNKLDNGIGSGCKITGVGKGGEVLFAVPFGRYREAIPEAISDLSQGLNMDYASWSGGIQADPARIEQDLDKLIISEVSKTAKYCVKIYTKNETKTLLSDKSSVNADLVLNTITGKILFENKPVGSDKIVSQKATVEILSKLLLSDKRILKNNHLGKYSKSRYDLQGKIALPISKITGLDFQISGGVYDDFSIKLKSFDISIAVVSSLI